MRAKLAGAHKGQSSVEALVVLPIFFFLAAAGVQLIWLFLAKHILLTATSYVAMHAAVAPQDSIGQHLIFQQRIRPVQRDNLVVAQIHIVTPTAELSHSAADYDVTTGNYFIDPAFATLQLQERAEQGEEQLEQWLLLSTLQVEIEWCFRLQVPGMGPILLTAFDRGWLQGGTGCDMYNLVAGHYYIPLHARVNAPLHAKRQWRLKN